jgi:hypothetical protein
MPHGNVIHIAYSFNTSYNLQSDKAWRFIRIGLGIVKKVRMTPTMLFLCPHDAAKGVMTAAYFQRLAEQQGIDVHGIAAGIGPSAEISVRVAALLAKEGIEVSGSSPQRVTHDQMARAFRLRSQPSDLTSLPLADTNIEQWDDMPLPSQDRIASRNRFVEHVVQLVERYT